MTMNSKLILNRQLGVALIALLCSLASNAAFGGLKLEGQNKGDTVNWYDGGLLVPVRTGLHSLSRTLYHRPRQ